MSVHRKIALAKQIEELEREQRMRAGVYPNLIARGKLRQSEADECNDRLAGATDPLRFCQQHEHEFREWAAQRRKPDALDEALAQAPVSAEGARQ